MSDPNQIPQFVPPGEDDSQGFVPASALPPAPQAAPSAPKAAVPPGAQGGPAFMFVPPAEAPRPPPDPLLGVQGGVPVVPTTPHPQPVDVSTPGAPALKVDTTGITNATVPSAAPSQPAAAPSPGSVGLSPEQKAARAKAIAEAAAKTAKGKRRLKIPDEDGPASRAVLAGGPLDAAAEADAQLAAASAPSAPVAASAPTSAPVAVAVAAPVTGEDLLDHPNVRAAKARIAAEKAGTAAPAAPEPTGPVAAAGAVEAAEAKTPSKSALRKLEAKAKRLAKREAKKAKKLALTEEKKAKREAKRAKRAAKLEAKKAAREAKLAANGGVRRGPGRPPGSKNKPKAGAKRGVKAKSGRGPGRPPKVDRSTSARKAAKRGAGGHGIGGAVIFTVRISKAGAKEVLANAKKADLSLSEFIRKRLGVD